MFTFVSGRRSLVFTATLVVFCAAVCYSAGQVEGARYPGGADGQQPPEARSPAVQLAQPDASMAGPHLTITLKDALERAGQNDAAYLGAVTDARNAREDRVQARDALLPAVSSTTQELLTTGGSILPTGRFVTNDGVHVYRTWGVVHEDLSPNLFTLNGYRKASAAEALAQARAEVAARGLAATVTQYYYGLLVAQRKYATAQQTRDQAQQFLKTSRQREQGGEAAHADVIKAQLQLEQRQQTFEEARLVMEDARLNLAMLLFPSMNDNFTAVDDLDQAPALPAFSDVREMAVRSNPDLKSAIEAVRVAEQDVSAARQSFLPTLSVDSNYGIEANEFALRGEVSGAMPDERKLQQNNLGEFLTFNLQFPVWDWGTLRSKLHQSEWRREQAKVELTSAQRKLIRDLYESYNEAEVSGSAVDRLRDSAKLADESLRLTTLRYQAGEATALEVVDAQNTLAQARNASDDGQARYRLAVAQLQTLTGNF
jgi:outer membrane protein TolC